MVDFQPAIYTAAAEYLREQFPDIYVTGEISDQVPKLPCAQIEESRNVPTDQDNADISDIAFIQYRVRIYSNKKGGRVTEARSILAAIDTVFEPLNLRRKTYVATSGLYNNSAYRIEATYEAAINVRGQIMRR